MTFELSSTLMIILLCWIILTIADIAVCGLLKLILGLPFKKAFLWGLLALILPPALIAYGSFIERNYFRVKEITIRTKNIPEAFDGYRIVHISDIHARSFSGREKHLQRAMDKINGLAPDMIAFTGDLITMTPDELDSHSLALSSLKAADGVFSVLGNHDYSMYSDASPEARQKHMETLITAEKELGWDLLMDENRIIRRSTDSIAVIGVQNTSPSRHFPSKGDLSMASKGSDGMFRILLSHDPMHWEAEILGQDYPLTLSGHTHAMQLSLLGWSPSSLMFKQYRGLYTKNGQSLHVNPGLGETIFPARIGVRPEITLITITR
ncbi:MAG: metallophosphoesterase [Bacteroidales bacterium]|nr:metallophosphoesterase [Bacteroidales bacterium]